MPRTDGTATTDHGTFDRRLRRRGLPRGRHRGRRSYDRLDHPRPGTPTVSVVIPTLNEAATCRTCCRGSPTGSTR